MAKNNTLLPPGYIIKKKSQRSGAPWELYIPASKYGIGPVMRFCYRIGAIEGAWMHYYNYFSDLVSVTYLDGCTAKATLSCGHAQYVIADIQQAYLCLTCHPITNEDNS